MNKTVALNKTSAEILNRDVESHRIQPKPKQGLDARCMINRIKQKIVIEK